MLELKDWNWEDTSNKKWLIPCRESAHLAEQWKEKGFDTFLDIGSGLGRHAIYMAQKGFTADGLDISDKALQFMVDWSEKEEVSVGCMKGTMFGIPCDDEIYDCIMGYNVFYHTDKEGVQAALEEARRILRPGGEMFATFISKDSKSYSEAEKVGRTKDNFITDEHGVPTSKVPHFFCDLADMKELFSKWNVIEIVQWSEREFDKADNYVSHYSIRAAK